MELMTFALLAVLVGMRHGMDGDHVAAIADMVGSEKRKRKQVSLGVMYAAGHGLIVFVIGLVSIFIGVELSQTARGIMEILVSTTLIALGGFILLSVVRQQKEYEYKSRLQIVWEWLSKLVSKIKPGVQSTNLSPLKVGVVSAFVVGIVHGIGVESPTQIALLTNAAGLDNTTTAIMQLLLFVAGLLLSTVCMTFCLSWGFMKARFRNRLYFVLGTITGIYSIGIGILMLFEFWKSGV